ncbi:transglutaminase superfamily protein [Jejuia pallidilutea]|uniref:Transglutaminase superfamily protein n=1 Tax=Jejuia pallidilutea TaxID=504487 RepID=A0A362WZI2_9FLAO|nr:DUF3857 domain-containing transglutaminase family protein [Jejuia pallidilutea]PQV48285.1 transglutaminase superfamily protein [Jejuia pallidilutea]
MKHLCFLALFLVSYFSTSQDKYYSSLTIPETLSEHANAVIRKNDVSVSLNSPAEMVVEVHRIITVLNKEGNTHVNAFAHYDNSIKIKSINASIFDANGTQIKKIRKNDFTDVSAVDGGTLYSDSRVKFLSYTPVSYPYTVEFTCETETNNTAFIESFMPLEGYYVSTENSSYILNYSDEITLRKKEENLENLELKTDKTAQQIVYKATNLKALKPEHHSPEFNEIIPRVLFASDKFALKGKQAEANNWADFGKWIYNDLVKDASDLSPETVAFVNNLVKDKPNDIEKAKAIYQYVQNKTRYISVQIGIGGWKPFNASEVDELGYGDCKGLTNYTMSLLKAVGVESYYTVLYASKNQRDIDKDFVSMQGNHAILTIPSNKGDLWLECTSQQIPFAFIGGFIDDRDVLVVKPEGGEIKHTKKYYSSENLQTTKGTCQLLADGSITATTSVISQGVQYNNKYWLESETPRDLDIHYKNRWNYINNFTIDKLQIKNDKQNIKFEENISFNAANYSKIVGNRMLLCVNALNRSTYIPNRYSNRKLPVKIYRGYKDVDEVEIKLPQGYKIEALPETINIKSQFGTYSLIINEKDANTLVYNRVLETKAGEFTKEAYKDFRDFYKAIAKSDNLKIALIKL